MSRALHATVLALLLSTSLAADSPSTPAPPPVPYMLECQGCHLDDGTGLPGVVPSLVDSVARFLVLPEGREFLVRVPGAAQSPLDDRELARVLNWMLHAFGPADLARAAPPYTAEEVAGLRRRPLVDVESVRRGLLQQLDATPSSALPNGSGF